MYWYIEKEDDRPLVKLDKVSFIRNEIVCYRCGGIVKRVFYKLSNRLANHCNVCDDEIDISKCKTRFDLLTDKEKLAIAKEVAAWGYAKGRYLYKPNDKELWYYLRPEMIKGISGGNRSGKTCTNVIDCIMQCEGWHPLQRDNLVKMVNESQNERIKEHCRQLLNNRQWLRNPPVDGRAVAVDFQNGVEKFVGPEFKKWLTMAEVKEISYDNEKRRRIIWKNGSSVEFMSQEQDLDSFGGSARDFVLFDEECPEAVWTENMMRIITTNGRILYGATAVNGVTWTEEAIWKKGESGHKDIYTIEMTTYDNPMNSPEVIDKIKEQCRDAIDIEIRIMGKRTLRGGHVYKMYKESFPHVIEPFQIPKDSGQLILAIDTHLALPHAILWIWIDYNGLYHSLIDDKPNLYEVASLFKGGTIPELAENIKQWENKYSYLNGRAHDIALCDPSAWNKNQATNDQPIYDQLVACGIYPVKGSKDLEGGILKVSELLATGNQDHPRLMTFKDSPYSDYLLYEKRAYHFPNPLKAMRMEKTPSQKPVDKDDHMMENERRIVEYVTDFLGEMIDLNEKYHPLLSCNGKIVEVDWNYGKDVDNIEITI